MARSLEPLEHELSALLVAHVHAVGFAQQRFDDYENDSKVPLGALAGYTALFGSRVVDFTAMFSWDSFFSSNADDGSGVDVKSYRVGAAFVLHSLVP